MSTEIQDGFENDELIISTGGLYTPFPVPAYKILAAAREHVAKDVLLCLTSHLGKGRKKAFPSITLIMKEAGRSRDAVIKAIRKLEDFGFIKKYQYWEPGKRRRSIYYLQEACWNNDQMGKEALAYAPEVGRCGCGDTVKLGQVGAGMLGFHHFGCGSLVQMFSTRLKNPYAVASKEAAVSVELSDVI